MTTQPNRIILTIFFSFIGAIGFCYVPSDRNEYHSRASINSNLTDPPKIRFEYRYMDTVDCYNRLRSSSLSTRVISGTTPITYTFSWGDGSPETNRATGSMIHNYPGPGTYVGRVIAENAFGSDTLYQTFTLIRPPRARFTFDKNNVCWGSTINFTNTSSDDPGTTYNWQIGNVYSSTAVNPAHELESIGTHSVTLTADYLGCTDEISQEITITPSPDLVDTILFSANCPCDQISFEAQGTADTWEWNMGDGSTQLGNGFTYEYENPNNYIVSVIGTDLSGCKHISNSVVPVCLNDQPVLSKANTHWASEGNNPFLQGQLYDFSSGSIAHIGTSSTFGEGSATMSHPITGELLFYSNGESVWDKNHALMPNGSDLNGHKSSAQSLTIIPFPADTNRYYVFTVRGETADSYAGTPRNTFGVFYSVVDMRLNGGLGAVTVKNSPIFIDDCFSGTENYTYSPEWLTSVSIPTECNKPNNFWVVYSACDVIHSRRIDASGIGVPVISPYSTLNYTYSAARFSPSGQLFAIGSRPSNPILLFDFDLKSGLLSLKNMISSQRAFGTHVAFSPDNSKLYAQNGQYDLLDYDISGSFVYLDGMDYPELAINDKIYYSSGGIKVINDPNEKGLACNLGVTAIGTSNRWRFQNIPRIFNFTAESLEADFDTTIIECSATLINLTDPLPIVDPCSFYWDDTLRYEWNFGDGFVSGEKNPTHTYSASGTYDIELTVFRDKLCLSDSLSKTITVSCSSVCLKPSSMVTADKTTFCTGDTLLLRANAYSGYDYEWLRNGVVISPRTLNDSLYLTTLPGDYQVRTYSPAGCDSLSVAFTLTELPLPIVDLGNDTTICNGALFSLDAGNPGLSYVWNTTQITQEITVNATGTYSVEVTDTNGCVGRDSIELSTIKCDSVNIDTIYICQGQTDTVVISGGYYNSLSSTGSFTQINDSTFEVSPSSTATYYVSRLIPISQIIVNSDFELPVTGAAYAVINQALFPGWGTTAADGLIEVWRNMFLGVPAYSGNQFIELAANMPSSLFQDIPTTPGTKLLWEVAHRGRAGLESMSLDIGPSGGPYIPIDTMTTGTGNWVLYNGIYNVPAAQVMTRFNFTWVSSGGPTIGNLIDAVKLYTVKEEIDSFVVVVNSVPDVNLGNDTTLCNGDSVLLDAGNPGLSHLWNTGELTQQIYATTAGEYIVEVTSGNGCSGTDTVEVSFYPTLVIDPQGAPLTICEGDSTGTITLSSTPIGASFTWTSTGVDISGAAADEVLGASAIPNHSPTYSGANVQGSLTYSITATLNGCTSEPVDYTVLIDKQPIASVGTDQGICLTSSTLTGNDPSPFTGLWTSIDRNGSGVGPGVITTDTQYNSGITGLVNGDSTYLQWTVSNGVCPDSSDILVIRVIDNETPSVTLSASPMAICTGEEVLLSATGVGTGIDETYEFFLGASSIRGALPNGNTFTSNDFVNAGSTPDTLLAIVEMVSNSTCLTSGASATARDTVLISVDPLPSTSNPGLDQTICASSSTMTATLPVSGVGSWVRIAGPGTISDVNNPTAAITGMSQSTPTTYGWVITSANNHCPADTATITITMAGDLTPANVRDQSDTICESDTYPLLIGNLIDVITLPSETGTWTSLDGATITQTDLNATITAGTMRAGNVYRFVYTIGNGLCFPENTDTLRIGIDANPITPTLVTPDPYQVCVASVEVEVNPISPASASGLWSVVTDAGSSAAFEVAEVNNILATINGLSTGITTVRFTVSNGVCAPASVDLDIDKIGSITPPQIFIDGGAFTNREVTDSTVELCIGSEYTLRANTPNGTTGETGVWTPYTSTHYNLSPGGSTLDQDLTLNSATFWPFLDGEVLTWSISSAGCGADTAKLNIIIIDMPDPIINPGDTSICENELPLTYNALNTQSGSALRWYLNGNQLRNTGTVLTITNVADSGYYHISENNGICPAVSSDSVYVVIEPIPDVNIQLMDINRLLSDGSGVMLNTEILNLQVSGAAYGLWSVIQPLPTSASFSPDDTSPLIGFNPNGASGVYVLQYSGWNNSSMLACYDSIYFTINVRSPLRVPDGFTPNGDGINDTWLIGGIEGYEGALIQVYGTWGNLVYESYNLNGTYNEKPWDGKVQGGKVELPEGVYYYVIDLGVSNKEQSVLPQVTSISGTVMLMR